MKKQSLLALVLAASMISPAWAEFPQNWYSEGVRDMLGGKIISTAIQADGALILSSEFRALTHLPASSILAASQLSDGSVIIGSSQPGALYQLKPGTDKAETLLSLDQGLITAVTRSNDDTIYAATAPQAKIYAGKGKNLKPVYNAEEAYIWDLAAVGKKLYFVTGKPGSLYELQGNEAKQLFRSEESNLRRVHFNKHWGLILGGGSKGIVYQYHNDKVSALLDTGFDEITAITSNDNGGLFIATNRAQVQKNQSKSAVYYIAPDGRSELLFPLDAETAYSLALNEQGILFIGTGNAGRVYTITDPESNEKRMLSLSARSSANQVSMLLPGNKNKILVFGSSPAAVEEYGGAFRSVGIYESDVLSTGLPATWGALHMTTVLPSGTEIKAWSRSGNTQVPDATWSDWSKTYTTPQEIQIESDRGRFLQLKFELRTRNPEKTPQVHSFDVSFLRDNMAPTVRQVYFLQRGVFFTPHTVGKIDSPRTLELNPRILGELRQPRSSDSFYQELLAQKTEMPLRMVQQNRPGMLTLAWDADDANSDELRYAVKYQSYGEQEWKTLATDINQIVYSFDSSNLLDGQYHFRVYADDKLSNPGNGYQVYRDSDLITLDNTAPEIQGLAALSAGQEMEIHFKAKDHISTLAYAEYALDGQAREVVASQDKIVDSQEENFVFRIPKPSKGKHFIVAKVSDRLGNTSTATLHFEVK